MMKIHNLLLSIACLFLTLSCSGFIGTPTQKVTITVVDDQGDPVPQAKIRWSFEYGDTGRGEADQNGEFSLSGKVGNGCFDAIIEKNGFYTSKGILFSGGQVSESRVRNTNVPHFRLGPGDFILKGPSEYTVTLKRIINPVPMYRKNVETDLPASEKHLGYDLMVGDWVAPYGKGKVSDLIVWGSKEIRDGKRYSDDKTITVTISFSNPEDGVIGLTSPGFHKMKSDLILPQAGPIIGYENSLFLKIERRPLPNGDLFRQDYRDENQWYILRVRTEKNSEGEVANALYGFIQGPIGIDNIDSDTGYISFSYALNPDPESRSLEWNGKNLFLAGVSEEDLSDFDWDFKEKHGTSREWIYPQRAPKYRIRALEDEQ